MIKKAKNLRVGDVIYLPKYNATAVVRKVFPFGYRLCINYIKKIHPTLLIGLAGASIVDDDHSIPVIGQAKIN
jgi:hypothetical protein